MDKMIDETRDRWGREALVFCASHGKRCGEFHVTKWANGALMAEVPGTLPNQAITFEQYVELVKNDWKIFT